MSLLKSVTVQSVEWLSQISHSTVELRGIDLQAEMSLLKLSAKKWPELKLGVTTRMFIVSRLS